ncbi:MAG: hypothetical protein ACXWJV_00210, partial [Hyphomicrobium sp.]
QGVVPAYSVVVPGTLPCKNCGPGLYCAVIVKRVDERTQRAFVLGRDARAANQLARQGDRIEDEVSSAAIR